MLSTYIWTFRELILAVMGLLAVFVVESESIIPTILGASYVPTSSFPRLQKRSPGVMSPSADKELN